MEPIVIPKHRKELERFEVLKDNLLTLKEMQGDYVRNRDQYRGTPLEPYAKHYGSCLSQAICLTQEAYELHDILSPATPGWSKKCVDRLPHEVSDQINILMQEAGEFLINAGKSWRYVAGHDVKKSDIRPIVSVRRR